MGTATVWRTGKTLYSQPHATYKVVVTQHPHPLIRCSTLAFESRPHFFVLSMHISSDATKGKEKLGKYTASSRLHTTKVLLELVKRGKVRPLAWPAVEEPELLRRTEAVADKSTDGAGCIVEDDGRSWRRKGAEAKWARALVPGRQAGPLSLSSRESSGDHTRRRRRMSRWEEERWSSREPGRRGGRRQASRGSVGVDIAAERSASFAAVTRHRPVVGRHTAVVLARNRPWSSRGPA